MRLFAKKCAACGEEEITLDGAEHILGFLRTQNVLQKETEESEGKAVHILDALLRPAITCMGKQMGSLLILNSRQILIQGRITRLL